MHRISEFIPVVILGITVGSFILICESNVGAQTLERNGKTISKSVVESNDPIRVADNSAYESAQSTRRIYKTDIDTAGAASIKGAPRVVEHDQGTGNTGVTSQFFQPSQKSEQTENRNPNSAPLLNQVGQDSDYQPAAPLKPVSIQNAAPSISTHIEVPQYINLNQPAKMRIKLQNSGAVAATSVRLLATIPQHAKFASSNPAPTNQKGQIYEFQITNIGSQETREVVVDLIPTEKKAIEIGTEVVIENVQRFTVGVREPKIKFTLQGPAEANLGQNVTHKIVLENTGDGVAQNIDIKAAFPSQLRYDKKNLGIIPALEPGQKIEVELPSLATDAGKTELSVSVLAVGIESQTVTSVIQIYQPELEIAATGPRINFLNREGIYSLTLDNTGEMDASNIIVNLQVPTGMKVTTISHQAKIDPNSGSLTWTFDRIAAKSVQSIKLLTVATMQGQQDYVFTVKSQQTKDKTINLTTSVVTRPELAITLQNQSGPVQVGGKVQFLVVVENVGSSSAADIKVAVELPDALSVDTQDGIDVMGVGKSISFTASKLEPGQKQEFRFVAVASEKGEHVVRTVLKTSASERQLVSEGIVFVYELNENRVSESLSPAIIR